MVKLQRLKKIFKNIANGAKKVFGKVVKPVVKFAIKKSPALLQNLVTLLEKGDPLKIRQILLNALPAGGYVNQVIDIVIALSKSGVYKEAMGLLEQLIDGKLSSQSFITAAKKILNGAGDVKKIYSEERKISDQARKNVEESRARKIQNNSIPQQNTPNGSRVLKKILSNPSTQKTTRQPIEEDYLDFAEEEEDSVLTPNDIFGAPVNK